MSDSIQRCPHDSENPYAQISRALIRDKSVSPKTRWFIMYCLSFDRSWKISIPYFMKEQDIGKDAMYAMVNEALESGYMKREYFYEDGLKRVRYFISENPKFKNILPHPGFPHPGFPHPEKTDATKEQESSYEDSKERTTNPEPQDPEELLSLFDKKQPYMKILSIEEIEPFMSYVELHKQEANNLKAWLMDCAKKKYWLNAGPTAEDKIMQHRILAGMVKSKYSFRTDIVFGYNYLEFINGVNAPPTVLKEGDKNYEILLEKELEKRKLSPV